MPVSKVKDFGRLSFNKKAMKENLPHPVYLKWKEAARNNLDLDLETADSIAHGMKEWALSKGATHFTHWFQPLTGVTAEKHDSFLNPSKLSITAAARPIAALATLLVA